MKTPINNLINKTISFLYETNLVLRWQSNLTNAELVFKNAGSFNTIFDMLDYIVFCDELCIHHELNENLSNQIGFGDFDLQFYPFYKSNLSKKNYYKTLFVFKMKYHEVIASAMLFIIENKLQKDNFFFQL